MFKYTNEQFDDAVTELKSFLTATELFLNEMGYSFNLTTTGAPESFRELKSYGSHFPISTLGCDKTIYGDEVHYNYLARFWHDVGHITMERNFSVEDEKIVIENQMKMLERHGMSLLARKILWADMYGQCLYYAQNEEFVDNQRAFVEFAIQHNIEKALHYKW